MRIKEITNAQDQLNLLRVIIDNTWSAIKQQADTQARQKATQPPKPQKTKVVKKAPYAPPPKPLQAQTKQPSQPKLGQATLNQPPQSNSGAAKQAVTKSAPMRDPEEMRMFINYLKGDKPKSAQMNQNRGFMTGQ